MELDILNRMVEIIKKDQGIASWKLTNKEKAGLIDVLRKKYPLNELLKMMSMPKNSYFYQKGAQSLPDKYVASRIDMKKIFTENKVAMAQASICRNKKQGNNYFRKDHS